MKQRNITLSMLLIAALSSFNSGNAMAQEGTTLKEVVKDKFLIGVALNTRQAAGQDLKSTNVVIKHFNAIVPENCMKGGVIHPEENRYDFTQADEFVAFGEKNNMYMTGHCLIWHSQLGRWFCTDENGQNVTPEVLKKHMKDHITTVVTRYKGRIKGWDVVNEAIVEDGSYRKSKFYEILGEEFIPLAFQYAHEADPDVELYYNDYNMNYKGRRETVVKMVKDMKARGIRIDAVGMQGHVGMDYPNIDEFEESIVAFGKAGVKVMITEWDMSALPTANRSSNISETVNFQKSLNPYTEGLPDSVSVAWNKRMNDYFNLFIKHSDLIIRVTAWGVADQDSWKNNFPVRGRTDYPLLVDRNYELKPFIKALLKQK